MDTIYSIKIEKHVLGGLIKIPAAFADVERYISDKDFMNEVHQTVFRVLQQTLLEKDKIDTVILAEKIKNIGISFKDDINIHEYLEAISFSQITYAASIEASRELAKLTARRALHHTLMRSAKYIKENPSDVIDEII